MLARPLASVESMVGKVIERSVRHSLLSLEVAIIQAFKENNLMV